MLRTLCSKVIAAKQPVLPTPALVRCLRGNYCTTENEDKTEQKRGEYSHCHVSIIGRLGSTPKEREGTSGGTYVTLNVAVNQKTGTNWHLVNVYQANVKKWLLEYVNKGDRLYVKGHLKYLEHKAREGDFTYKSYVVNADQVSLINRFSNSRQQNFDLEDEELEVEELK